MQKVYIVFYEYQQPDGQVTDSIYVKAYFDKDKADKEVARLRNTNKARVDGAFYYVSSIDVE